MNEKLVNLKEKLVKEYSDFVRTELKNMADGIILDLSKINCMFEQATLRRTILFNLINQQDIFEVEELVKNLEVCIFADEEEKSILFETSTSDNIVNDYAFLKLSLKTKIGNTYKDIDIAKYKLEVRIDELNFLAYKPAKEQFETE